MTRRNDIPLTTLLDGRTVSHFKLREFENRDGLAMVHPLTLRSLEEVRRDLGAFYGETVQVIITGAVRTREDLERLAARYGWADQGGLVARQSRHLAEFGGIAADLKARVARTGSAVPQKTLGRFCRLYFDWVKDDYADGHVHADNRARAR
ncbi:MAG TPA: hypothetical protein PLC40_08250 [Candidatus Hydrogenedentes bacterium]|nr:hypothetical protein [Candidatus Hydrogenedentota bacterium]